MYAGRRCCNTQTKHQPTQNPLECLRRLPASLNPNLETAKLVPSRALFFSSITRSSFLFRARAPLATPIVTALSSAQRSLLHSEIGHNLSPETGILIRSQQALVENMDGKRYLSYKQIHRTVASLTPAIREFKPGEESPRANFTRRYTASATIDCSRSLVDCVLGPCSCPRTKSRAPKRIPIFPSGSRLAREARAGVSGAVLQAWWLHPVVSCEMDVMVFRLTPFGSGLLPPERMHRRDFRLVIYKDPCL